MMNAEYSCGAVVFTRAAAEIRYVIISNLENIHGFPKGHMEPNETEEQTALREIKEETGLRVSLLPGFRTEDQHSLAREGRPDVLKHITYFLAEYADQRPCAQESEVGEILLLSFDAAMKILEFPSSRRILQEAHDHLTAASRKIDK